MMDAQTVAYGNSRLVVQTIMDDEEGFVARYLRGGDVLRAESVIVRDLSGRWLWMAQVRSEGMSVLSNLRHSYFEKREDAREAAIAYCMWAETSGEGVKIRSASTPL